MKRVRAALVAAVVMLPAGVAATALHAQSQPRVVFGKGRVQIATERRQILLDVEVARTPDQHQQGLMFRRSLPRNAGMVFVFQTTVRGGFWMKNTLIPLSIAFYDRRGRIVKIMVMEPCKADPCPVYDPGVAYRGALEVNKGSFRRWRVQRGDTIKLLPRR